VEMFLKEKGDKGEGKNMSLKTPHAYTVTIAPRRA